MKNKLNITWCYPDILNLNGDKSNIKAFEKVAKALDLDINISRIDSYDDIIDFKNTDILLFNSCELNNVEYVIKALKDQKKELKKYLDSDKILIAIGTSGAIFANRVVRIDKGDLVGLELLNMNCYEREEMLVDDLMLKVRNENIRLIGSQVQTMDIIVNDDSYFADVEYGYGNNKGENIDGARYRNLIYTNMIGPLFVKNPWFTQEIIKLAMKNKKVEIEKCIDKDEFEFEYKSFDTIKKYIEEK